MAANFIDVQLTREEVDLLIRELDRDLPNKYCKEKSRLAMKLQLYKRIAKLDEESENGN